jgi:hypothetical protein
MLNAVAFVGSFLVIALLVGIMVIRDPRKIN